MHKPIKEQQSKIKIVKPSEKRINELDKKVFAQAEVGEAIIILSQSHFIRIKLE